MKVGVYVQVTGSDGLVPSLVRVRVGQSYRDELKRIGIGLIGECDSAMICATCHIKLNAAWQSSRDPSSDEEQDLLETLPAYGAGSRLSCQTLVEEWHEGLTLELPASSIHL